MSLSNGQTYNRLLFWIYGSCCLTVVDCLKHAIVIFCYEKNYLDSVRIRILLMTKSQQQSFSNLNIAKTSKYIFVVSTSSIVHAVDCRVNFRI
jgi:hypothetical protein